MGVVYPELSVPEIWLFEVGRYASWYLTVLCLHFRPLYSWHGATGATWG